MRVVVVVKTGDRKLACSFQDLDESMNRRNGLGDNDRVNERDVGSGEKTGSENTTERNEGRVGVSGLGRAASEHCELWVWRMS